MSHVFHIKRCPDAQRSWCLVNKEIKKKYGKHEAIAECFESECYCGAVHTNELGRPTLLSPLLCYVQVTIPLPIPLP